MTRRSKVRLGDLFPALALTGDYEAQRSLEIHRIAPVEKAREGDLVFIAQENLLPRLKNISPSAAVVSENIFNGTQKLGVGFPLLRTKDAMLAFAKASAFFKTESASDEGVHPTAFVHPSARLGAGVSVGPHAVVGEEAELENGVVIHARASVGPRVHLGADSVLFPGVVVYQDCHIGSRVRIHANSVIGADGFGYVQERSSQGVTHVKIHHLGGVRIGDDVEIGASSTIDRGTLEDTIVERGCIIDNQVQIGHNCHIEEGVIICGCSGLAGSVRVGKFAVIAGFVAVGNKIQIGAGARVSGFSAINGHVPPGVDWGGIPGMPHGRWLRTQVLLQRLPELLGKKSFRSGERNKRGEEA